MDTFRKTGFPPRISRAAAATATTTSGAICATGCSPIVWTPRRALRGIRSHPARMPIAIGLYALLRPGETLYSVTGQALRHAGGRHRHRRRVKDRARWPITASPTAKRRCTAGSEIDLDEVRRVLVADRTVKVVFVQRSKGYHWTGGRCPHTRSTRCTSWSNRCPRPM